MLFKNILYNLPLSSLNATLHTLMETFVTVSVQSEIAVRKIGSLFVELFQMFDRLHHFGNFLLSLKDDENATTVCLTQSIIMA